MRCILVVVTLGLLVCPRVVFGQSGDATVMEIKDSLSRVPPANFRAVSTFPDGSGKLVSTVGRYAGREDCTLDIQGQTDGSQRARVSNPNYWFEARRLSEESEWVLTGYAEGPFPERLAKEWETLATPERYVTTSVGGFLLVDLLESDNVTTQLISQDAARKQATLELTVIDAGSPVTAGGRKPYFSRATVTLRDRGYWAISETRLQVPNQGEQTFAYEEWEEAEGGVVAPKRVNVVMNGTPVEVLLTDLTFGEFADPDAFTLGAFGLPTPVANRSFWSISFVWVFGVGVLLVVIAGWMQFAKKE